LLGISVVWAQKKSPYRLKIGIDLPILTVGIGFLSSSILVDGNETTLTQAQVSLLNKNDVNAFDRGAIRNFSKPFDDASDILMVSSFFYPIALFTDKVIRKDFAVIGLMVAEVTMINVGITNLSKRLVRKNRPFTYNPDVSFDKKSTLFARESFFSGHTSNAAAYSFFAAKVISDYSDNPMIKKIAWSSGITIPAIVGYFRYKAGKHFPSDIITGYVIGAFTGFFIPHLHKNKDSEKIAIIPVLGEVIGVNIRLDIN